MLSLLLRPVNGIVWWKSCLFEHDALRVNVEWI